jgi:hypothetical protein
MSRAACVAFLLAAAAHSQPERPVKFSVLRLAPGAEVAEPSTRVFRTEKEWKEFLREHSPSLPGGQPVDFGKETVAAVFAGQKPTGGYSVQVTKVVEESRSGAPTRAAVHYRVVSPPPDAVVIQVLTYPSVVIRIAGRFDQVEFRTAP